MARYSLLKFFRDVWAPLPDHDALKVDLTGKTVVVTGSNIGLGFEAAKHFARMGPGQLIMAVRNEEKGNEALLALRNDTGYLGGEVWHLDLEDFSSTSKFADRFAKEGGGRLDILVENAGIMILDKHYETKDGWERTLQTNYLGTVLLGLLLLPFMSKTGVDGPTPRLVLVSSEMHYLAKFSQSDLDAPNILQRLGDKKYSDMPNRYPLSKLLCIFFMRSLVSRLPVTNPLIITAVNPSFCKSNIDVYTSPPMSWILAFTRMLIARTTEVGSRTLVHAALGNPGKRDFQGAYLSKCEVTEMCDFALSEQGMVVQERIWEETIEVLKNVDPRVDGIVKECLRQMDGEA